MAIADSAPPPVHHQALKGAGGALAVLTGINLLNYLDRYILPPLVGSLKGEWQITDAQAGLLVPSFLLVYMVVSPIFGTLADRGGRTKLIALGVALWSVATLLGGFAAGFIALLMTRALVGVGEAAYGTIAPSLLADYFPKDHRGRVFAIFYMAMPVGAALGYILGGFMDTHFGWRSAFFIAGVPGVILALLTLRLPNPRPGVQDDNGTPPADAPATKRQGTWRVYLELLRNRRYAATVYGYAAYTFGVGALSFWMPEFLKRTHPTLPNPDTTFGAILVVTGFVGTFAGGWLGDRVLRRTAHAYLLVSGIATLLAVPLMWVALTASAEVIYIPALIVAELLVFASTGPINSALINYVSPTQRASAMGLSILAIHLLGDSYSPTLVGWISDHSTLQDAMGIMIPVSALLAGLIWTVAALRFAKEKPSTA